MWLFIAIVVLIGATVLAYIKTNKENINLQKRNVSIVNGYYPQLNLSSFWEMVWFFVFSWNDFMFCVCRRKSVYIWQLLGN